MRITPVGFDALVRTFLLAGHSASAVKLSLEAGCFAGWSATHTRKNNTCTASCAVRIGRDPLARGIEGLTGTPHDDKHDNHYGDRSAHDAARPFKHGCKLPGYALASLASGHPAASVSTAVATMAGWPSRRAKPD
ncbi:MAG TPA: hypothetical protein VFU13_03235 [Steroidobacteraceae bacterium]|nr:hypothetical protein [Steroidobacteraceae bacterium]